MGLKEYHRKRKFDQTPEPRGKSPAPHKKQKGALKFVVQMHEATRLHYDFRIELDGLYRSWAVPKGPSINPLDRRLAVRVEDHPLEYGHFEGIIPKGNYGAGTVMVWDTGTFLERNSKNRAESETALRKGLEAGHVTLLLEGHKLRGEFALVRIKKSGDEKSWLLLKKRDEHAAYTDITRENRSVLTNRDIREIAAQSEGDGDVWLPDKGRASPERKKKRKQQSSLPPPPPPNFNLITSKKSQKKAENPSEPLPRKLKPMMASHGNVLFDDPHWIFEAARDGHRAIAEIDGHNVKLHSRALLAYEKKYPQIVEALHKTPHTVVLDGEIVSRPRGQSAYVVQDILHLDGENLRDWTLFKRKKKLEQLPIFNAHVICGEYDIGHGKDFARKAARQKFQHVFAKRADSLYRSGISREWLKIPVTSAAALEAPRLVKKPKEPKPQVASTTRKPLHVPATSHSISASTPRPTFTNLNKVYWSDEGYTKGDLLDYYKSIAPYILPYLKDRPESLNRHPNGIHGKNFFQKDLDGYIPRWIKTERVYSESAGKTINYALCQDEATLLYLVNLGCIELNPWISRVGQLDKPDFAVIDLDPDGNDFSQVIEAAQQTHALLKAIGAPACLKTSGATGLHICVPIEPKHSFDDTRNFAEAVCQRVHAKLPSFTSLERNPSRRRGKIYLDFLQNRRGQTLAAPYCVRPRPGATVSAPLKWSELKTGLAPKSFTIQNMLARIQKVGDLWKPMLEKPANLEACLRTLLKLR